MGEIAEYYQELARRNGGSSRIEFNGEDLLRALREEPRDEEDEIARAWLTEIYLHASVQDLSLLKILSQASERLGSPEWRELRENVEMALEGLANEMERSAEVLPQDLGEKVKRFAEVLRGSPAESPREKLVEFFRRRLLGENAPWPREVLESLDYDPPEHNILLFVLKKLAPVDPLASMVVHNLEKWEQAALGKDLPPSVHSPWVIWTGGVHLEASGLKSMFYREKERGRGLGDPDLFSAVPHSLSFLGYLLSRESLGEKGLVDDYGKALERFLTGWGEDLLRTGDEGLEEVGKILKNLGHSGWESPEGEVIAHVIRSLWRLDVSFPEEAYQRMLEEYNPERIHLLKSVLSVLSPLSSEAYHILAELKVFEKEIMEEVRRREHGGTHG